MEKHSVSVTKVLFGIALIAGATYFLFYTEKGREWLERLKNTATDQIDRWLADLETYLQGVEMEEEA